MICELLILFNGGFFLLVSCAALIFRKELRLAVNMAQMVVRSQMGGDKATPPQAPPPEAQPVRKRIKFKALGKAA